MVASILAEQGEIEKARHLYLEALSARERKFGSNHPEVSASRRKYQDFLKMLDLNQHE